MSPSFLLLPGEIRVNIYEYLFNEECRIEFTHYDLKILAVERGYHWTWSKAILESQRPYGLSFNVVPSEYVAILRTCHQVYDEAIPIFLARTFFCYAARLYPRLPSGRLNHDSCQLPVQRLQDIQKLEVNVEREEKIDSRTLAEMVASLVEDASALKRLFLIFFLQPGKGAHNSYRTWLQSIVHTSRIAKTIAAANDLQEIHITVSDDAETGGPDFEPLIYAIAPKESWSFDLEDYCYDEGRIGYAWRWVLAPASKQLPQSVPGPISEI